MTLEFVYSTVTFNTHTRVSTAPCFAFCTSSCEPITYKYISTLTHTHTHTHTHLHTHTHMTYTHTSHTHTHTPAHTSHTHKHTHVHTDGRSQCTGILKGKIRSFCLPLCHGDECVWTSHIFLWDVSHGNRTNEKENIRTAIIIV